MNHSYFLIVSNGRTGSSWLETSLGVLSDVAIDFEFKWQPASYKPGPIHKVISHAPFSSCATLNDISDEIPVLGSKLVLDPYIYLGPEIIASLRRAIENNIAIVHLSRSYFDTMLSWGSRRIYNTLTDRNDDRLKDTMILSTLQNLTENHDATIRPMNIFRGPEDKKLLEQEQPQSMIPFENVVNLLLNFFYNDLICRELAHGSQHSTFVRYSDINARLPEIARFVGSTVDTSEIEAVISNPVTRRIGGLGPELVRHADAVQRVSTCLDQAMDEIIRSGKSLSDVWTWSTDRTAAAIRVNGLKAAVIEGLTLDPVPAPASSEPLHWLCQAA